MPLLANKYVMSTKSLWKMISALQIYPPNLLWKFYCVNPYCRTWAQKKKRREIGGVAKKKKKESNWDLGWVTKVCQVPQKTELKCQQATTLQS